MVKTGDRIIMVHEPDEYDDIRRGDYGTVISIWHDGDLDIRFKRIQKTPARDITFVAHPDEVMVCKKRMTWEQIRVLADVVSGV